MKKIIIIVVICTILAAGTSVSADGDHLCNHHYTTTPQGYETSGIGHTPYWECIYCGHTNFGTVESHDSGNPVYTTYGTANHCFDADVYCEDCNFLISHTVYVSHQMGDYYDDFGDPQKHDYYYRCITAVWCGYIVTGPILQNHTWNGSYVCIYCDHAQ